jgi:phytoene synthase
MSETLSARLARSSGTSFYYAFRVLPQAKRRAIYALYSFCRVVDDCVDELGGEGEAGLDRWLAEVYRCYGGKPETELGRELAEALFQFPIPRACLEDIVAGCRMDLTIKRYPSFEALRGYCLRVASAVGLASIEVFGYDDPGTRDYAIELGLALQLTNILRDVSVDAARDRIYLPQDQMAELGVSEQALLAAAGETGACRNPQVTALLDALLARAKEHYASAAAALPDCDRRSMLPAEIMGAIYYALLGQVKAGGYPMAGPRIRLSKPRKVWAALRTVPRVYWRI